MDLVFFGIQGSGKGTQAKRLAAEKGYHIFEAGAELRSIAASGTDLGNTVKSYIDEGHLVPHGIIMQVVEEAVRSLPQEQEIIFDGVPRDSDQMQDFNAIMNAVERDFRCINIVLDEEEAFKRILERAEQQGRADDADPEKIRRRMLLFHEKTEPVIDAYRQDGRMIDVDGNGTVAEVYSRLKESLGLF